MAKNDKNLKSIGKLAFVLKFLIILKSSDQLC